MKMTHMTHNDKNKGFTLVELIVVLVILAILAAIIIPALLGYIDRAKEKQDIIDAKACITATQALLAEEYGKTKGTIICRKSCRIMSSVRQLLISIRVSSSLLMNCRRPSAEKSAG